MSQSSSVSGKFLFAVSVGIGVTVASGVACWYYHQQKKKNTIPEKWRRIGILQQINLFPIKSCAPLKIKPETEVWCDTLGLCLDGCRDRALMLIDDNNQMITARMYPKMVLIAMKLVEPGKLAMSAANMPTLELNLSILNDNGKEVPSSVWGTKMNVMLCGEKYDKWFSKVILDKESGLRLVHYPVIKPIKAINPRMVKEPYICHDDRGAFNDATSYMMMNLSSIGELNTRIPRPVDPLQFRGSFHLEMDKDEPYAEDRWGWVKIGEDAIFRVVAPCTRCIFPNINVYTGERDPEGEPLKTLKSYRQFKNYASPALGIHLGLRKPGAVKTNYVVYVEDK